MQKFAVLLLVLALQGLKITPCKAQFAANDSTFSARKATVYSAIIPGLGQAYNQKYWKLGVIYASIGGMGVLFANSNREYQRYQNAYVLRIDGDVNTVDQEFPELSDNAVRNSRDFYRRNRDISVLGFIAIYAFQMIDANVDAHLREFSINEDLSLQWQPFMQKDLAGVSFSFRF